MACLPQVSQGSLGVWHTEQKAIWVEGEDQSGTWKGGGGRGCRANLAHGPKSLAPSVLLEGTSYPFWDQQ